MKAVHLKYGSLAKIRKQDKDHQKLTDKQAGYAQQINYFIDEIKKGIKNQGDAFFSSDSYLEGGI